jgi:hypothetical protein
VSHTGTVGSSAHESRTFDCPWCGAISPVPADHLGEHFACPECRKATKLTEKNTSALRVTDAPPDAPHLTGDRTFDCPWCGAISSVPSSHLGERFHCPECARDTKLTPTNTRRAPITAPPPDAPPPAEAGAPKGLLVMAGLVVAGVVAWGIASAVGSSPPEPERTAGGPGPSVVRATPPPVPTPTTPPKPPPELPPSAESPTPAPTEPTPPAPDAPPPVPAPGSGEPNKVDERAAAEREVAAAEREVAEASRKAGSDAETSLARERALAKDPELAAAHARQAAFASALGAVPPVAAGSVDAIRAYNAAVAKELAKTPAGAEAAEAVRTRMAAEAHGRGVAGLAWQDLDFHGDAFVRAAAAQREAWTAALGRLGPPAESTDAAQRRRAEADERLRRAIERRDALAK